MVVQARHYYTFGMEMSQLNNGTTINKYQYNGKEIQDDFGLYWYDYGARFYDPMVGRFHTIDPLSENYYFQSPYAYAANNPIKFIDVNGEFPWGGILARAIWNGIKKPEGKPVISANTEITGTTMKFALKAAGLGGTYANGAGELGYSFSFQLHNNGHINVEYSIVNRNIKSESSLYPIGGRETEFEESKEGISTDKGYFKGKENKKEEALTLGDIEIDEEKVSFSKSIETSLLFIGIKVGTGVDVYSETFKMQKVRDGIEGEEKRVYSDR